MENGSAFPRMAMFRDETTRQATTFNLDTGGKTFPAPRGQRVTLAEVKGSGHIASLWMTFPGWFWQHWNTGAAISQSILKTLILRIYWDGAARPAVECPAGDFFGLGLCEAGNFASSRFGLSSGGFFCKFPMPYRKSFRIEVENLDEAIDTVIFMNVLHQEHAAVPEEAGYFHAQFNTGRKAGSEPLWVGEWRGRGHFAGLTLAMQGEDRNYLSFLEAPEHIHIDDDWDRPRITGTGLEDYFLGGWYFREGTFAGPHHGVPSKDTLNASIAMYRIHEDDAVRFRRRFKMGFVNPWSPDRLRPYAFSSAAFAYVDTPEGQGAPLPGRDGLLCWHRTRNTDHQSIP